MALPQVVSREDWLVARTALLASWDDGCPSCSAGADEVADGLLEHLHTRDTTPAYVSRAPIGKSDAHKGE